MKAPKSIFWKTSKQTPSPAATENDDDTDDGDNIVPVVTL